MIIARKSKTAAEVLDFTFDWTDVLTADSDTISSCTWTITGATAGAASVSGMRTTTFVSGGTAGATASIRARLVTTGGRTYEREITLRITE